MTHYLIHFDPTRYDPSKFGLGWVFSHYDPSKFDLTYPIATLVYIKNHLGLFKLKISASQTVPTQEEKNEYMKYREPTMFSSSCLSIVHKNSNWSEQM